MNKHTNITKRASVHSKEKPKEPQIRILKEGENPKYQKRLEE